MHRGIGHIEPSPARCSRRPASSALQAPSGSGGRHSKHSTHCAVESHHAVLPAATGRAQWMHVASYRSLTTSAAMTSFIGTRENFLKS